MASDQPPVYSPVLGSDLQPSSPIPDSFLAPPFCVLPFSWVPPSFEGLCASSDFQASIHYSLSSILPHQALWALLTLMTLLGNCLQSLPLTAELCDKHIFLDILERNSTALPEKPRKLFQYFSGRGLIQLGWVSSKFSLHKAMSAFRETFKY